MNAKQNDSQRPSLSGFSRYRIENRLWRIERIGQLVANETSQTPASLLDIPPLSASVDTLGDKDAWSLSKSASPNTLSFSTGGRRNRLALSAVTATSLVVHKSSSVAQFLNRGRDNFSSSKAINRCPYTILEPGAAPVRKLVSDPDKSEVQDESAIDSDTDDYVDESAIDDDEWEDSMDDSGKSSVDENYFQRIESNVHLVSRPSLITLMVAQNERQKALSNQASHSASAIMRSRAGPSVGPVMGASPNDSDEGQLMMKGMRPSNLKPIIEVPRSVAQAIPAAPNYVHAPAALSPRTTRRNMLATELTESLRRHLLWERQQKTSTANAVLKRRNTSHDVANLKQFPDKPCLKQSEDANASSWNQYFNRDAFDGYHSKGW
ncbi:hypothetical protein NQ176_g6775 [Zarea fungicola]|uniref:Uncharacterized protein n=1 Tax=Zarea fungicola TaxID=93591 RepID=A0ACC1N2A8_9HYPO|nr:hypothetical protein NQ176_g6775 [Lecanicillium fungicola]